MLKKKRIVAFLLALTMIFGCMTTVSAADAANTKKITIRQKTVNQTVEVEETKEAEVVAETEPADEPAALDTSTWLPEDFTYGEEAFELYPAGEQGKKIVVNAWVITGFSESGSAKAAENKDLVIPAADPNGKKVQGVGKNAFLKAYLDSVTFPENVTAPWDDSTWNSFGKGLTERGDFFIGYASFRYNNFKTLDLPYGVIYLDTYAFANNTLLESSNFPKSVMQIRTGAFYKCALTSITFAPVNDFGLQLDAQTFGTNKLTEVQLPSNTEKLDKWTFIQNTGMEPITSGTSAEKKGGLVYLYIDAEKVGSFVNTSSVVHKIILGKMPVPAKDWCEDHFTYSDATTITGLSDLGKEKIKEDPAVIIPEGVTALGDGTNMTGIFVYTEDGKNYAPASITLPSTLTAIGKWTFALNASLTYENEMTEITLPEGLVSIGQTAFQNSKLTSIVIPDSVTTMGTGTFTGSGNLTSVTLSKNLKDIPQSAFAAGASKTMALKEVVIPEGVETIGRQAFHGAHVEALTLPSTLKSIGQEAFGNHQLTELTIPGSVTEIGKYAFRISEAAINSTLAKLTLNEGLVTIGQNAFDGSLITELDLPSTVVLSAKNKAADLIFGTAKAPAEPIVTLYVNDREKVELYNTDYANSYSHVVVFKGIDISDMTAALEYDTVEVTGEALTPAVTIEGLVEGTDFTVEYQNNVEVGTATVVITGIGAYEGTIELTFAITEKPVEPEVPETPDEPEQEEPEQEEENISPVQKLVKRVNSLVQTVNKLLSSLKRLFSWF